MKKKKYWIEHIVWEDHYGGDMSWTDVDEIKNHITKQYFIHTTGIVMSENDNKVLLLQNLAHNGMASHSMYILKSDILKRKKLAFITMNEE